MLIVLDLLRDPERTEAKRGLPWNGLSFQKGGVVLASHTRADCASFWLTFPPLQAVPSFACSVASLSRFPGHQLPGWRGLHREILAGCLFG